MLRLSNPFFIVLFFFCVDISQAGMAQAAQLQTRVDIPSGYKTCQKAKDCIVTMTSCRGFDVCCEFDAVNEWRAGDYSRMNKAQCQRLPDKKKTPLAELQACTICEPLSSHSADCINHICVSTMP
jgi:hypothetical protein